MNKDQLMKMEVGAMELATTYHMVLRVPDGWIYYSLIEKTNNWADVGTFVPEKL
jgi:hypothetical protein